MSGKVTTDDVVKIVEQRLLGKHRAPVTVRQYVDALRTFEGFLLGKGIDDLRLVTEEHVGEYLDYVRSLNRGRGGKKLAPGTVQHKICKLRKAFALLVCEDMLFTDPFKHLQGMKKSQTLPRNVLTEEEVRELLAVPDTGTFIGYRDRTVMETLYGTGMRLSELTGLDFHDVDFGERVIYIRKGKGGKQRVVPCTGVALAFLRVYLDEVRPALCFRDSREKALFLNAFGERLTPNAFRLALRGLLKRTRIGKKVSPHTFRHTFATHMLEGGANVRYIQEILGHEQLSTTAVYTRVTIKSLKQEVKRYHPRENELYEDGEVTVPTVETLYRYIKTPEKGGGKEGKGSDHKTD